MRFADQAGAPSSYSMPPFLSGILLPLAVAAAAIALHQIPALSSVSPMMLAILIGIMVRNVAPVPEAALSGTKFLVRHALRVGIVLLGIRLTLSDIASLGGMTILIIVACVVGTFFVTIGLGRLLGVPRALSELIAAGTSICGASAVIAIHAVRRGPDEDMAYAIATVTLIGSIAMVSYPLLAGPLGLDPTAFGVWTGATVHEVAQVTAASYQQGEVAGNVGTVTKLGRVVLLVPIALGVLLSMRLSRDTGGEGGRAPVPWFVAGFLAMVVLNSFVEVPEAAAGAIRTMSELLLVLGLAAAGLQAHLASLLKVGLRPLLVAIGGGLFIAALGLTLVKVLL